MKINKLERRENVHDLVSNTVYKRIIIEDKSNGQMPNCIEYDEDLVNNTAKVTVCKV